MQREVEKQNLLDLDWIKNLETLNQSLLNKLNWEEKLEELSQHPFVQKFLRDANDFYKKSTFSQRELYFLHLLIVAGQGAILKEMFAEVGGDGKIVSQFFASLEAIEAFYAPIGGILGYHVKILKLLAHKNGAEEIKYLHPSGIDLSQPTKEVKEYVIQGISSLKDLAEIYPVGGAGERLGLKDEKGESLPVACLQFCGKSLLEGLIRDLQAREYLYYKIFHEQLATPIVLMTSFDKENDRKIKNLCEEREWFGRAKDQFFFLTQPEAPVLTKKGNWSFKAPLSLYKKPGGHGVLWFLCKKEGAFDWLRQMGRHKVFVRQINNPIAGTDYGLLGFFGFGYRNNKAFGFASCPRKVKAAEGTLVLFENLKDHRFCYHLGNIEYAEFSQKGIQDSPETPESPYSIYPANTNLLYGDIASIDQAVDEDPFPGLLVNMKTEVPFIDPEGNRTTISGGRLESMMQNISEAMVDTFDFPLEEEKQNLLRTFVTFYNREKTISATKKNYDPGGSLMETPEGCFYELQKNMQLLLASLCQFEIPSFCSIDEYVEYGPSTLILLHPAIGPIWEIIGQKLRYGKIHKGSEFQLEIVNVDVEHLNLQGSCLITADQLMGHFEDGVLCYSEHTGKCELKGVTIINQGIDRSSKNVYWQNSISRKESFSLHLHGNAEFYAENVTFRGNQQIEVPAGHRMIAEEIGGSIRYHLEPIDRPSWCWEYRVDAQKEIHLIKKNIT